MYRQPCHLCFAKAGSTRQSLSGLRHLPLRKADPSMPIVAVPSHGLARLRAGLTGLVAVVATASLGACGSTHAGASTSRIEKPDLTVAVVPASGAAGVYVAQMDGFFAQAGLHVRIVPVTSGSDVLADLVRGSVDIDQGQWTSDLAAQAAGVVRLHAVAPGNAGGPGVEQLGVLPGSGIRGIRQLAGKTIAVNALQGLP